MPSATPYVNLRLSEQEAATLLNLLLDSPIPARISIPLIQRVEQAIRTHQEMMTSEGPAP